MKAVALLAIGSALLACPALADSSYPAVRANISCPGDRVVWVNTRSHVYHFQGETWFGHTKHGRFECEKQAQGEGDRATKNGQ
jgi:hypothetical protein